MNAVILGVGNELISGQTVDTNSAWLARRLAAMGISTVAHHTVGDDRAAISAALRLAAGQAGLVLVTGGLGPTADDLTRQGLADAMGTAELVLHDESLAELEAFFRRRGRQMVPANRVQVMFPVGSEPIANRCGTAPGIAAKVDGADVYVTPGVPHEMRAMFDEQIAPRIPAAPGAIVERILHTFGTGESDVGSQIGDLMDRGANPTVGTTVAAGLVSVRVTACGTEADEAEKLAHGTLDELRRRLGDWVVGEGEQTMASVVGRRLVDAGQTLATAESCTGGLIGEMITAVSGSSEYFLGGFVTYANDAKADLLGVDEALLAEHGAVSEPVARAMADGCRQRLDADWALAVTGIAGPTGGTEEKPVGLVFIALAGPADTAVHRHVFPGDRGIIRRRAATAALNHLRLALREA